MRANHYRFINFSIPFIDQGAIRNVGIKERFLLKESAPEDNPSDRELDEIISSLLEGEIFPEELTGNSLEELAKPSFGKSAELSLDEISSTTLEDEISLTSSFVEVPLSPSPQA
ncbi:MULTISPECIES: hypothetical protein [unclassified Fibrobacter]|uniref:hypothetical protein n=1 Tax=unclassified Fibrobacter TaxID=2634177 RepID=UPI00148398C6|nr:MULTISPECIES: hypothetical protein [unclassified Fibrobacter]